MKKFFSLSLACLASMEFTFATISISKAEGWLESAFVEWTSLNDDSDFNVYVRPDGGNYVRIDKPLIRKYNSYYRADALGLPAGNYQLKVVPIRDEAEVTSEATETELLIVRAHDRNGFAHFNWHEGVGAYTDNGNLKEGALVLYVHKDNAKTITADIQVSNPTKYPKTTLTGIQAIIAGYQKGYETRPLDVRIIGLLEASDMDELGSSAEGLQIKGNLNRKHDVNITIEGVGNDAVIRGFGFLVCQAKSVEMRNFAIMSYMDDGVSIDDGNSNVWLHHLDLFYGKPGSASDQKKGDGAIDVKNDSKYVTISYNHFWDTGKTHLSGMRTETGPNYITYHHNWYDHSDSRHPRIRTMSVHVYNNFFDGVAKYGVGAVMASSVFVENNYFLNCSHPMLISMQGTDTKNGTDETDSPTFSKENGGIIKAFNNIIAGTRFVELSYYDAENNPIHFDAYLAQTRDEQVPAEVKAKQGESTYDNFDTDLSLMPAITPDDPNDIPEILASVYGAGRMFHGDFNYSLENQDPESSDVNEELANLITNYESSLQEILGFEWTDKYQLTVLSSSDEGGAINGSGKYIFNSHVEISALPNSGYYFTQWSDGVTDNPRTIIITQDTSFTAEFAACIQGKCGENLSWTLYTKDSTLIIEGSGEMSVNFSYNPWRDYKLNIAHVTLSEGVINIGGYAFTQCDNLKSIIFPSTLKYIEDYAFCECTLLREIVLPDGLESISHSAFWHCNNIEELNIPNTVTIIGHNAFSFCSKISKIYIPSSVISIGDCAFGHCDNLTSIEVDNQNTIYDSRNNCNAIIETSTNTLISGCVNTIIPISISHIGSAAFYHCSILESISIPESVTTIGDNAFYYCKNLKTIFIPKNISSIGIGVFTGCNNLLNINVDDENPTYSSADGVLFNKDKTKLIEYAYGKTGLYNIPEGVNSIEDWAFENCLHLDSISFPYTLSRIGVGAFSNCADLRCIFCKSIIPPILDESVFAGVIESTPLFVPAKSIDVYKATDQWKNFTNIQPIVQIIASGTCGADLTWSLSDDYTLTITGEGPMYEYNWDSPWYDYRDSIRSVIVSEGVTTIGATAFRDCRHMQQCSLPSTLQSIGNEAFCFCFQLISVDIPQSCTNISGWGAFNLVPNLNIQDEDVAKESGARSINGYVEGLFVYDNSDKRSLRACSSAAKGEITLDDAIERIEYMAFAQCEDITHINFGSNLQYIGEWSLDGCRGLDGLQFQEGLTEIATHGFGNCFGLRYVSLPNSLTTLGDFAIGNCPDLRVIRLGDSLKYVGYQIFDYCQSIDTIYASMPTPPVLDETAFASTDLSNVICIVPNQSVSLYKNALVWKQMNIKSIDNPEPCTIASGSCGENLTWKLTSDSVLTIEGSENMTDWSTPSDVPWYENRLHIAHVSLPDALTGIGKNAFNGCSNLKSISIPENVTIISDVAFNESGLNSVVWNPISFSTPSHLGSPLPPFRYICSQITSFVFGNKVETIPASLCSGMSLTSIEIPNSVTSIERGAFSGCINLNTVRISDINAWYNIEWRGSIYAGLLSAEYNLYLNDELVTELVIPEGRTTIGNSVFKNCCSLTSVTIPTTITQIGYYAFDQCSNLTSVRWNAINCEDVPIAPPAYTGSTGARHAFPESVVSFVFGEEVQRVPGYLCAYCTGLTSLSIPANVTDVGEGAFYGCTNITSFEGLVAAFESVPSNKITSIVFTSGVLNDFSHLGQLSDVLVNLDLSGVDCVALPKRALYDCYLLRELVLPANLETIGYMAVANCKNLQRITIPASVTDIAQSAFEDCRSLKDLTFAENSQLETIGAWAFYNCHNLPKIEIPEGVTEIGDAAFYGCVYAESLKLPASVQSIGDNAFALCSKLDHMDVDAIEPPAIVAKTFYEVSRKVPVYVPEASVDLYKSDPLWKEMNIVGRHDTPTAVETITNHQSPITNKILRNGQILILRGEKVYTVTGQEVR